MKALTPSPSPRKRKSLTRLGALAATLLFLPAGSGHAQKEATTFQPPPLTVAEGFEVSLAAAPPLVNYPMMACFDDQGRLYVAESDGRNLTTRLEIEKELPRFVRRLVDTDHDGVFDQSTIFADKMTMPEGGLWHNGALYIISAPYLWRLEDTDGDGVADKREKILGEMEFDGRANQHGPYLGPNGRLYFSGGHFGYQFTGTDGSKTGQSRAGGVFSCRPDGSDVRIDGQGPINPVEVAFTKGGEVLSTAAIYDSFGGKRHDALIHWLPRGLTQRLYGAALLPETGHRLPAIIRWGQVAPAGLMRYRSSQFGKAYEDSLFACHFNTGEVVRIKLKPDGATFQAEDEVFLSSSNRDFHPADILEDADGSLLLLDTGGWLSWGCPHSQAAKPEIKGAIYRIRRKNGPSIEDPRGARITWDTLPPIDLAQLLADPRPAVRDRAQALLISRGLPSVPPILALINPELSKNADARRRAVFTLSQISFPPARFHLYAALKDPAAIVRQAAARSLGELRDRQAASSLVMALTDADPGVRRNAASALGRIGAKSAVAPLFESLSTDSDPSYQHGARLALIEIGDNDSCAPYLKSPHPPQQAAALRVLEQINSLSLTAAAVVPLLQSASPIVRDEARRVVAGRPDWKEHVFGVLNELLGDDNPSSSSSQLVEEIMLSFALDKEFHQILTTQLTNESTAATTKAMLLVCLGYLNQLPEGVEPALATLLESKSLALRNEACRLIVSTNSYPLFSAILDSRIHDIKEDALLRTTALEAASKPKRSLTAAQFKIAAEFLQSPKASAAVQRQAARALSHLELRSATKLQAESLCDLVKSASPFHLPSLLEPFQRLNPEHWPPKVLDAIGENLAHALKRSPGRKSLSQEQLTSLAARFPAEKYPRARAAFSDLATEKPEDSDARGQRLDTLLAQADSGNASRGRVLFHAARSTCALCHSIDGKGGTLGPNLSKIGGIRSTKDLLEAIVFPSATVVNGFESYVLSEENGTAHTGLIHRENADAFYLRNADQSIQRIPRARVKNIVRSPVSLMPTGLDGLLSDQDLADLVAYLQICK